MYHPDAFKAFNTNHLYDGLDMIEFQMDIEDELDLSFDQRKILDEVFKTNRELGEAKWLKQSTKTPASPKTKEIENANVKT